MTNRIEAGHMAPHDDITHDEFALQLPEYLEGTLDDAQRSAMDAHAAACEDCATLATDLLRIEAAAAQLPELTPSRDLWAGIASRIDATVTPLHAPGADVRHDPQVIPMRRRWMRPAAVAAAIVLATGTLTYAVTRQGAVADSATARVASLPAHEGSASAAPATNGNDSVLAATGATTPKDSAKKSAPAVQPKAGSPRPAPKRAPQEILNGSSAHYASYSGEQTYDAEIARLRTIVRQRRGSMDSTTLAVIEKNLRVIDDAIAQCRQALARDPNSRFLLESLNGALDTKVQLLRTAAMLPART